MSLLAPLGLLVGLTIPVILALHLRRPTRRLQAVSTLRFWREVAGTATKSRAWRRPPRTRLFWLQLLIALLVTLALARLVLPWPALARSGPPGHLVIVLDRSATMFATDVAPTRFAAASARARDLLDRAPADSAVTLITMGSEPVQLRSWNGADRGPLRGVLAANAPVGGSADLAQLAPVLGASLLPGYANAVVVLWGGVPGTTIPLPELEALPAQLRWEQFGQEAANVAITRVAALPPRRDMAQVSVFGAVTNFSTEYSAVTVTVEAGGTELGRRPLSLGPGATAALTLLAPPDTRQVSLRVDANDAMAIDNVAWAVVPAQPDMRVVLVSSDPGDLGRALAGQPGVQLTTIPPERYAPDERYDLTVFDRFVPDKLPAGNMLVVAPPIGNQLVPALPAAGAPTAARLDGGSDLLRGVDLSAIEFRPQTLYGLPDWAREIAGARASTLILDGTFEGHRVVVFGFDPRASNLTQNVAFPLLVGNTVDMLRTHYVPRSAEVGQEVVATPLAGAGSVELQAPDGNARLLPLSFGLNGIGTVRFRARLPGVYTLVERDASGAALEREPVAVNAGSVTDSNLLATARELPAGQGRMALASATEDTGFARARTSELWGLLVAGALALLLGEWWLAYAPGPSWLARWRQATGHWNPAGTGKPMER